MNNRYDKEEHLMDELAALEAEHRALLDESLRVEKALVDELAELKAKIENAPWSLLNATSLRIS